MDELTVIADGRAPQPGPNSVVLRFADLPSGDEVCPNGVANIRDHAARKIKTQFGPWLFEWMRDHGGFDLAKWEGDLSWWWYAPISERSPLRGDLVVRVHQLIVFKELLLLHKPQRVLWFDSLPEMRESVVTLAAAHGCQCKFVLCGRPPWRRRMSYALLLRVYSLIADIGRHVLHTIFSAREADGPSPKVLFMTWFPNLWERHNGNWRERMYGRLPEYFERHGLPVAFAALTTGAPLRWLCKLKQWHQVMALNRVHPLLAECTVRDVLRAHFIVRFWARYVAWRMRKSTKSAVFEGIDIGTLLCRELDLSAIDPGVPSSRLIARNLPRLLDRLGSVKFVLHPFEYQPIEKAAAVGANTGRRTTVVGLQTGVYTSGQLGLLPNADEIRTIDDGAGDGSRALLPDVLVTYGSLMSDLYAPVMGTDRVLEAGALRYGELAALVAGRASTARADISTAVPAHVRTVLVACSSVPEESLPMVRAALALAVKYTDVHLVFKFHYHLPIDDIVATMMKATIPGRWRIEQGGLHDLILSADVVMTGASSVAYESLALQRVTLVYTPAALWNCCAAAETPNAFAFWQSENEMFEAYHRALNARGAEWDKLRETALDQQLKLRPDGEERLLERLRSCQLAAGPIAARGKTPVIT